MSAELIRQKNCVLYTTKNALYLCGYKIGYLIYQVENIILKKMSSKETSFSLILLTSLNQVWVQMVSLMTAASTFLWVIEFRRYEIFMCSQTCHFESRKSCKCSNYRVTKHTREQRLIWNTWYDQSDTLHLWCYIIEQV